MRRRTGWLLKTRTHLRSSGGNYNSKNEISLAKGPPQLFVYTGRLWRGSYERLIKFPKWRKASRMKATRMYKRRERRRAKRETTNGGMILNGEHVLTMRLVVVFVFSAPRPLVWDITF